MAIHFYCADAPSGSGKTRAATQVACERIPRNIKSVICQPTIRLCKQSVKNARENHPELKPKIRSIVSRPGVDAKISAQIVDYLNTRDQTGELLYITHAGLLRTPNWHRADSWHLFLDEVIDVVYHRRFRLEQHRDLLIDLFSTYSCGSEKYDLLMARDHRKLRLANDRLENDEVRKAFADFTSRLVSEHWKLYVDKAAYAQFEQGKTHELQVHGLLQPSLFEQFASTSLMAANLQDSIMYRYFDQLGCTFEDHKTLNRNLRYQAHANGSRLVIKYLSEAKWSKTLRNKVVHRPHDEDGICVGDLYMELCKEEANKHSLLPPLWIGNNDIKDGDFDGVRLSNVPHGMNDLQQHDVCCIMSALNPPQGHRLFLEEMTGMTERQIRRALLSQTAYQALGRGILRDQTSTGMFLLIVPDRDTANDIAEYYPGCRIEPLLEQLLLPNRGRGRPAKYGSDAERRAAEREQDRARKRRVRKKALYLGVSPDITPEECRSHLSHVLTDWAEAAPQWLGASGFARSDWLSQWDRDGQGHTLFTPTVDLVSELQRKQQITRISKDANPLICPVIFCEPPRLPDSLIAMGISIEWSMRAKNNALACRGFLLDIENGDMIPQDFSAVFPDLEFIAYSSWSHTTTAPRYRIGIPSSQHVPPDIHVLLLHTLVQRLEQAGWGDALADGRKHGLDIGKLNEAAMFYLPSSRPDCFFLHQEGRPLDPKEWVSLIPDDLLLSPPPPARIEMQDAEDVFHGSECGVEWAIEYWRQRGCMKGRGRTQLWLLAKRLAQAGCDETMMRSILSEQAGFATNPEERRSEIDGLLQDRQVMAARLAA